MIVKILNRSASFHGSWLYHFHDKGSGRYPDGTKSSERVGLYGVRNLGTNDPAEAFKHMALTWYSAAELKKKAGISNRGRKCTKPLITLVMSYNSDYSPEADEIQRDIENTLHVTRLTENQVVWVLHKDTANVHVHIMVNAVNPENGVTVQFDNKVAENLQDWAKQKERGIGVQCHGRENSSQAGRSHKFIPSAERRARERIVNMQHLQVIADDLAEIISQEWNDLRHRERQELSAVYHRMQAIKDLGRSQRQAIKSVTASRIKVLYKKKRNPFFLTTAWLENNEWKRLGLRTHAARRLFYKRERSVSGAFINAIHLALSDIPDKRDFICYLLSKNERKSGLESWINQEYINLKLKQKTKKNTKLKQIRVAEHECYIGLSRHIQNQIQREKNFLESLKREHSASREKLKNNCKLRWDAIASKRATQQSINIKKGR